MRNVSWVSKKSTIAKARKSTLAILRIPYFIPHMEIVFVRRGVTCCVTGDLAQCFDSMSYTQTDETITRFQSCRHSGYMLYSH